MDRQELSRILASSAMMELRDYREPGMADPYSDMTREELIKLVLYHREKNQELVDTLNELLISQKQTNSMLAESNARQAEILRQSSVRDEENKELRRQLSEALKTIGDLNAELKLARKNRFGSRSDRNNRRPPEPPSREEQKEAFDGSQTGDVRKCGSESGEENAVRERSIRQKDADRLRTGSTYRTMRADNTVLHRSDLSRLPAGAVILRKISRYSYDQTVRVTEHEYELVRYKLGGRIYDGYFPAQGEPTVIDRVPGTKASSSLLAHLAFNRFALDTPLYREIDRLRDERMRLSRMTLTNWLDKGAGYLVNIVGELKRTAIAKDSIINCDETWCKVRVGDRYRRRYIWCLVNKTERIVIYCYEDGSRGRDALRHILGDADLRALQSDGYNVYMYLDNELVDIDHIGCMAHARAKFMYAMEQGGDKDAEYVVGCIAELYGMERSYRTAGLTPEQIKEARNATASLEVIGRLRSKLDTLVMEGHPPRGELMDKAVNYLHNMWDLIFRYRKDGRYSIDNTIAERYIRPLAGERKNSLFFGSHRMARVSAIYHTVLATCRARGLSGLEYLKIFFREIVTGRRDYHNLTPITIGIDVNNP